MVEIPRKPNRSTSERGRGRQRTTAPSVTLSAGVLYAGIKLPDPPDSEPPPEYRPGLLTRLAVWWLRRRWEDRNRQLPDRYYVATFDVKPDTEIVMGPCVIEPPGLGFTFRSTSE